MCVRHNSISDDSTKYFWNETWINIELKWIETNKNQSNLRLEIRRVAETRHTDALERIMMYTVSKWLSVRLR